MQSQWNAVCHSFTGFRALLPLDILPIFLQLIHVVAEQSPKYRLEVFIILRLKSVAQSIPVYRKAPESY